MERDKKLQDILQQNAEGASPHFTDTVMNRVQGLSALPFQYRPMVSSRLRKAFVIVFASTTVSIVLLCLIVASAGHHFTGWQAVRSFLSYVYKNYYQAMAFILIFWFVFIANSLIEKRVLLRKYPGYTG